MNYYFLKKKNDNGSKTTAALVWILQLFEKKIIKHSYYQNLILRLMRQES